MSAFNGRRDSCNFHVFILVKASIYSDEEKKILAKRLQIKVSLDFKDWYGGLGKKLLGA